MFSFLSIFSRHRQPRKPSRPRRTQLTFAAFLATAAHGVSSSTYENYRTAVRSLYRFNGQRDMPMSLLTVASGPYVLQHFKDHADQNITSPYINVQNTTNPATQACVVWADESGLVIPPTVSGAGTDAFVNFEAPASAIKNGNAVIAVKNASGTVMWSWHLWFAPQDVLNTTEVTNFQSKTYKFINETLGFKYTVWRGTTYSAPRSVKVKVEQTVGQAGAKQVGYITITQNNGNVRQGYSTLYQFGRKDALPGTDAIAQGNYTFDNTAGGRSLGYAIQHPENMFCDAQNGTSPLDWCNATYGNLWSADNTADKFNDNTVVKTIYDPSPAGFKMPASNAFTGFATNGQNGNAMNVSGDWENGWNFNNKLSNPDATVYFPASGYRYYDDGSLRSMGDFGFYWSSVPYNMHYGCCPYFSQRSIAPKDYYYRSDGASVRPVSE